MYKICAPEKLGHFHACLKVVLSHFEKAFRAWKRVCEFKNVYITFHVFCVVVDSLINNSILFA